MRIKNKAGADVNMTLASNVRNRNVDAFYECEGCGKTSAVWSGETAKNMAERHADRCRWQR